MFRLRYSNRAFSMYSNRTVNTVALIDLERSLPSFNFKQFRQSQEFFLWMFQKNEFSPSLHAVRASGADLGSLEGDFH